VATIWAARSGVEVGINSLRDHSHMVGSLHYADFAVDLDTAGDLWYDLISLFDFLDEHLVAPFEVIFESNHIHVEFDP